MGVFVKGDAVVSPFAFCGLSSAQRRPAFGIADLIGDDGILCQITTQRRDGYSIPSRRRTSLQGDCGTQAMSAPIACSPLTRTSSPARQGELLRVRPTRSLSESCRLSDRGYSQRALPPP